MIKTEKLIYAGPGGPFEGTISWNPEGGPKPGVLISHAWGGQSDFETGKAVALAELGYVGFAIDNYGQGRRAQTPEDCAVLMNELDSDRGLLRKRMQNALAVLKNLDQVDKKQTAAIGFCFGGKCVLDLARAGGDLKGVVSFHGLYDPPAGRDAVIKAKILALHGWDDPLATPEQTVGLGRELTARGADWQLIAYGHTAHAFTNPAAAAPADGMFYQQASDKRSWLAMRNFLHELFAA